MPPPRWIHVSVMTAYDALLVVSFGGPNGPDDVLPFLENVLRGRNVPRERMLEVAEHYRHFSGRSPINDQNLALIAALEKELAAHGPKLPIYWGNRNWHPLLADTLGQMATDGVKRALAFVTSAYSSYSSCRQYRENIAVAQAEISPSAPQVDKLRVFFNHPGFIEPMIERTREALELIPAERRGKALLLFTAHSIPAAMAAGCRYEDQLREASRLVAEGVGRGGVVAGLPTETHRAESGDPRTTARMPWQLVYQSRSGPPSQAWLEPDVGEFLQEVAGVEALPSPQCAGGSLSLDPRHPVNRVRDVVVVPIGFISDHMEVLYDLDTEVRQLCERLGINMVRAGTVGTHPRFVKMIRELIEERMSDAPQRRALGAMGPSHDVCPDDCCLYVPTRPATTTND
jgi:protoporphyrin/coproporphyrin ferrochelatase